MWQITTEVACGVSCECFNIRSLCLLSTGVSENIIWKSCYSIHLLLFLYFFFLCLQYTRFLFFFFLYPRHGSVCSTIKVMLPNITVLLHSYSPALSPHAQSNADKLAMCHGYPQCHKTVTAECHIISSPPLLSLSDRHFLCSAAQFFIHSNFVTSHWRSVLLAVHSSSSSKQTALNTTLNTLNPTSHHCCQLNYTRTAITTLYLHTPAHSLVHRRQADRSYGSFHNVTAMGYWTGYCHKRK